jgi:sterol-4alpha-carboxylate 3-dehydrogenase (decarboxylating)
MLKKSVMSLNNTTILITGGLGQIGLAILHALQKRYPTAHLHVLDLQIPGIEDVRYLEGVKYHKGDIVNRDAVGGLMAEIKPGVIFHTAGLIPQIAARLGLDTREGYMGVNVEGTRILLDEAGMVGSVRCFVFMSSADVVKGNSWQDLKGVGEDMPIPGVFDGWYAESKVRTAFPLELSFYLHFPGLIRCHITCSSIEDFKSRFAYIARQAKAETLVLSSSSPTTFPTTALRTHGVFSAHDRNIIPLFLAAPRNIRLGPGNNLYDFTYAPNLAQAHVLAAENLLNTNLKEEKSAAGKAFFVTNSEPVAFKGFLGWIYEAFDDEDEIAGEDRGGEKREKKGQKEKVTEIPIKVAKPLVWVGAKVARMTGKKAPLTSKELGDSVAERWFDNGRAREVLGYIPAVGLKEGVRLAVEGFQKIQKDEKDKSK